MPTTGIVDVHASDGVCDLARFISEDGGVLFIQKATEGVDFSDRAYQTVAPRVLGAGLLLGLYHFGNGNDPIKQADHFLRATEAFPSAVPILDCEKNEDSDYGTMSFDQAAAFLESFYRRRGVRPMFYTYEHLLHTEVLKARPESRLSLAQSPLWIAKYGPPPKAIPKEWAAWKSWTLWQYSSSVNNGPADQSVYPRGFKSFARKSQDRSVFSGTPEELRNLWKTLRERE